MCKDSFVAPTPIPTVPPPVPTATLDTLPAGPLGMWICERKSLMWNVIIAYATKAKNYMCDEVTAKYQIMVQISLPSLH